MKFMRKITGGDPCVVALLIILGLMIVATFATTFSDTYDTATPAGSDDPAEADDRMREIKSAVQERENVDHYWPLTGTEVSDADTGEHRKILFHAPIAATPTVAADHGELRIKDVSGKAELVWTDEDENELQLTSKGNNLANDTYLTATDNAGIGSVNLIKATTGDIPEVLVGAVLSADTAPAVDAGIANKKYVDDQIAANALALGDTTIKDDDENNMLAAHAYLCNQDGMVEVTITFTSGENNVVIGYDDSDANPAAGGDIRRHFDSGTYGGSGRKRGFSFLMASGRYFEITVSLATVVIRWAPFGTLIKCTDQD